MLESYLPESETLGLDLMTVTAFSERDLAHGVTHWIMSNFQSELADAVRSSVFSEPLLCAIACKEAGAYWLPLTPHKSPAEILGLCVYDASGDVAGAPRNAFPVNTAQFRLNYGDAFTTMLINEANKARAARGLAPASIVYKGYGIFQYDLQHVRSDEAFFRTKQWYSFTECVNRAVMELKRKFDATDDIQEAVRAYNGSGPRAEQYARDVMRLLPFCEEAAAGAAGSAGFMRMSARTAGTSIFATDESSSIPHAELRSRFPERGETPTRDDGRPINLDRVSVLRDEVPAGDDDPGFPMEGETSDTADFDTARILANLGVPTTENLAPSAAAIPVAGLDYSRALMFLQACRTSAPRVTYGLGKKVPFFGAVPGRDFTKVDCSGFVREAIRRATTPPIGFPDGSVVQHDWIRAHGFERSTVRAGREHDGVIRIAFLRPQDSPHGIGHVALIANGRTLESHSGVGPNERDWTGMNWQAKAFVYVLARDGRLGIAQSGATFETASTFTLGFTVRQGRRYRASISLNAFEKFASNDQIASMFSQYGFTEVVITGTGTRRQGEGTWAGPDTTVQLDPHLTDVVELSEAIPVAGTIDAPLAAPSIIRNGIGSTMGNISANVFSSEALPLHHDELLAVRVRSDAMAPAMTMALNETAMMPSTAGLSALSFYERAGMIKRVVPLSGKEPGAGPRLEAATVLMAASVPSVTGQATRPSSGVSFIELERGQDPRPLQTALASDPNIVSVSKVPVRYLAARAPRRTPPGGGIGIAATPPDDAILWNLRKIQWKEAREAGSFMDAEEVRVAVLDSGVDDQHPDLEVDAYHWKQPDLARPVSNKDIIGHGTHVCGTIAALINNPFGVKGVCRCSLNVWKIFDDEPTYAPGLGAFVYYVNPIMYRRALADCVEASIHVMNLSIGGRGAPDTVEQLLFSQLIEAGVTICAAMGNERQYGSPISYPAAIPGVIAVGATGLDDRVTVFSNSGNHIAVAAPGKSIWSTLPTYGGQTGFGAVVGADGRLTQGHPIRRDINYDAWDGTSMATPHVSGCAALLIAKNNAAENKLTPQQVKDLLMTTADQVPAMNGATFSTDYGAGRVNLLRLLQ